MKKNCCNSDFSLRSVTLGNVGCEDVVTKAITETYIMLKARGNAAIHVHIDFIVLLQVAAGTRPASARTLIVEDFNFRLYIVCVMQRYRDWKLLFILWICLNKVEIYLPTYFTSLRVHFVFIRSFFVRINYWLRNVWYYTDV